MEKAQLFKEMKTAVLEGEIEEGEALARKALDLGADPLECIEEGFVAGINEVGELYEAGDMFLPELVAAAEVMKEALAVLEPELSRTQKSREILGKVLIGSVAHDIHDIGKDIVASMLTASGFEVVNLGIDVSGETFVGKIKELKPDILGMSALLTTTMPEQKNVIEMLKNEKLLENLKVMVGGAPVNKQWADSIGADGFAENAVEAVKVALIRDAAFFGRIEEDCESLAAFEPEAMAPLIERCAALHVEHIAEGGDPFETGSARPLDFGHWAAHKLEQISSFRLSHGEAVAMGIALDVVYAEKMGYLSPADRDRILALLQNLGFALFAPEMKIPGDDGKFLLPDGLEEFREHLGGKLTITLLRGIGEGFEIHHMNKAVVEEAIAFLEERDNQNASLTSSRTGTGSPRS